jgi:hypothetical protein
MPENFIRDSQTEVRVKPLTEEALSAFLTGANLRLRKVAQ